MKTILFQGDSITDARRERSIETSLGMGYAGLVAGMMGLKDPNKYDFINRGIGGNRVVDLYARWKMDCLNLKPDYVSILVGVNDVWHELEIQNGLDAQQYEKIYRMLLEDTMGKLPDTKIILMTPFLMKYSATEKCWDYFYSEVQKRSEIVCKLAGDYNLPLIELQSKFNEMLEKAPVERWTADGVHPTMFGHGLIAREWVKCFEKIGGKEQ